MQNEIGTPGFPRSDGIELSAGAALAAGAALGAALLGGCSTTPDLEPAPGATPTTGEEEAEVSESGIALEIHTEAWSGTPAGLDRHVSPVLVTLTNDAGEPLRVRYPEFSLTTPTGQEIQPISPFEIEGTAAQRIDRYAYPHRGFLVAPHIHDHRAFDVFEGPFMHDAAFYEVHRFDHFPDYRTRELPTDDMLQRALPEGVLEPGGSITGYLYFEHIEDEAERATLAFDLTTATTGQSLGTMTLPLVADDHRGD